MVEFDQLFQFAGFFMFFVFIFYGQKLQVKQMLMQIKGKLALLKLMRDNARLALLAHLLTGRTEPPAPEFEAAVDRMVGSFVVAPVDMDPRGIVQRVGHVMRNYSSWMRVELKALRPDMDEAGVQGLENSLEVAIALSQVYRVVEHFYLQGKKMGLLFVYQLIMVLPLIMDLAKAYSKAAGHFATRRPMGDGFGPMVARGLVPVQTGDGSTVPETSQYSFKLDGRDVFVAKAKGPGGTVGRLGDWMEDMAASVYVGHVKLVVTVDAALKMEGEKTGDVAEGVGVVMGGIGVDRYQIEGACAKVQSMVVGLVCKMTLTEAITDMPEAVKARVEGTIVRATEIILKHTQPGDVVVVLGVGNTMGVE